MKKIIISLVLLLVAGGVYGQKTRKITARVLDAQSGKPVFNANVTLFKTDLETYTNFLGYFELEIPRGFAELIITHIGFLDSRIEVPSESEFDIRISSIKNKLPLLELYTHHKDSLLSFEEPWLDSIANGAKTHMAIYKLGWHSFLSRLDSLISTNESFYSQQFSGILQFGVSKEGELFEMIYKSDSHVNRDLILNSLSQLADWIPAKQNGINTLAYFELPLSYGGQLSDEIFQIVEDPANPIGGYQAFYDYVGRELRYPVKARSLGIEGKVYVQFVVQQDGRLVDVQAVRGIGGGCDEEAVRVIRSAPQWSPPMQRGKPVKQRIILPVTFKIGTSSAGNEERKGSSGRKSTTASNGFSGIRSTLPEFPGGGIELYRFIKKNKKNINQPIPPNKSENAVVVKALIKKDGTIGNVEVIEGLGKEHDDEAIRLFSLMPNWTAGTEKGKVVDKEAFVKIDFGTISSAKIESAQGHYEKGVRLFGANDYPGALEEFSKAIDQNPTVLQYYFSRGVTYIELYQNDKGCANLGLIKDRDQTSAELFSRFCEQK